jgi:hypothetical protein
MRRPRTEARSGDWMTQKGLTNRGPCPAVAARDHMRFMIIDKGSVTAYVFIEVLKRTKREILLIVMNLLTEGLISPNASH